MGLPYIFNSILIDKCLITEKHAMRNPAMYKHLLEELRTAIAIILFKNPNTP
jgi:hypothetical protein